MRNATPSSNQKARERASVILQVRSGQITATQGATILGISRKTYYQWEKRALAAMMDSLQELEPGRPRKQADPAQEAMEAKIARLETQLKTAEQTAQVRAILMEEIRPPKAKSSPKKRQTPSPRSST